MHLGHLDNFELASGRRKMHGCVSLWRLHVLQMKHKSMRGQLSNGNHGISGGERLNMRLEQLTGRSRNRTRTTRPQDACLMGHSWALALTAPNRPQPFPSTWGSCAIAGMKDSSQAALECISSRQRRCLLKGRVSQYAEPPEGSDANFYKPWNSKYLGCVLDVWISVPFSLSAADSSTSAHIYGPMTQLVVCHKLAPATQTFNRSLENHGMFNFIFPIHFLASPWTRLLPPPQHGRVSKQCSSVCVWLFLLNQPFPIVGLTAVCVSAVWPLACPLCDR